jgi:hypothetical protein
MANLLPEVEPMVPLLIISVIDPPNTLYNAGGEPKRIPLFTNVPTALLMLIM